MLKLLSHLLLHLGIHLLLKLGELNHERRRDQFSVGPSVG